MKIANIPQIQIIYKRENGGISRCKNTGIRQLAGCDCLFLADDDLIYNGKWWEIYTWACEKTKISHFAFRATKEEFPFGRYPEDADEKNGVALRKVPQPNGCFLFFHRSAIDLVGGFKVMPYKFGFEHLNMTERLIKAGAIPCSYDVIGSNDFLHLNMDSFEARSMIVDTNKVLEQQSSAMVNPQIHEECEE
jgi:GT2 family glycosyltransferase